MNLFEMMATLGLDSSAYDKGLNEAEGKATGFGTKLKTGLATAAKVGAAALGAATTAAVGFGAASVKTGEQFDKSMSQVAATMGFTVTELQDGTSEAAQTMETLRDFAQQMGSTTVFSATQAADALNYMALAGYDAETSMQMLPNVLNLAASGNIDLARASDMVTDAQSALGITLDQTSALVDQMASTASSSNTSVAQLGEAILTIGGTAQFMAGGTDRLNTVLGILADNGIKGSEAGTHLRNMLLKLSSPTKEGADVIAELGLQIFDAEGNMRDMQDIVQDLGSAMADMSDEQKVQRISALFNARDVAAVQALLGTTTERWNELGSAIVDSTGAAEAMAEVQLDNLSGDITLFQSALEGAKIAVSDELTPSIREFVQFGSGAISTLTEALKTDGLDGVMDALGTIISDGLALFIDKLPEMIRLGLTLLNALVTGIIDNLPEVASAAVEIIRMIGTALIQNGPTLIKSFGKVITEIIDLITEPSTLQEFIDGAMLLIETLADAFIDNMPMILSAIMRILTSLITTIQQRLPQFISMATEIIRALVEGLVEALPVLMEFLPSLLQAFIEVISENLPTIVEAAITIMTTLVEGLIGALPLLLEYLPTLIESIVTVITENLPTIIQGAIQIMMAIIDGLVEALPILIEYLPTLITTIVNVLTENLPLIIDGAIQIVMALAEGLLQNLPTIIDAMSQILTSLIDFILGNLPEFINKGMDLVMGLVQGILDNLPAIIDAAIQLISNLVAGLIEHLPELIEAGITLVGRLVLGLIQAIPQLIAAGPRLIKAFMESFQKTDWRSVGINIVNGIKQGIINMATNLANAAREMVSNVVNGIKNFLGIHSPSRVFRNEVGKMIGLGLAGGIEDSTEDAVAAAEDMAKEVVGEMGNLGSVGAELGSDLGTEYMSANGLTAGYGTVTINVYGAEGQDVNELAEIIGQKLAFATQREGYAWA